ncbi:hypothetical protein TPHA_0A00460 [Tetrapisispora phaffii CBS 4417]|uniref:Malate dehydrogenase n=1 Tax=Tetrapisispora phaffii (strain ATCC 24235 / CBS 4417 / NBRC 1672 / NRRL Y-8282 / UCD 70-5) TaxID=1071381 RepID=G8BMK3_TETPH|nr:hypothetical protein TPHA_0A00460 [Tetrapisispora phaffii CBS 4417]CCE61131.1 hypothetical protein TPHA_0A00460 [Tetrapisispora phaffii CBS 4417]
MPSFVDSNALKISIIGAAGGIGQAMCLLLKAQLHTLIPNDANSDPKEMNMHIHMALYDVNNDAVRGVATDLSHIDTPVTLSSHSPNDAEGLRDCLIDTDLIVVPAGFPRKPGMTRDDLFIKNAEIISGLADNIAAYCDMSKIFILLISNPVNSLIPLMGQRLVHHHPSSDIERRIMGVTKLDIVRASTFLHQLSITDGIEKRTNNMPEIPVIGGHSGDTIIPLFSRAKIYPKLSRAQIKYLIHRVQTGGDEVVKAKNGQGSATLSMALAAHKVVMKFSSLLLGLRKSIHGIYYVSLWSHSKNQPICSDSNILIPLIDGCKYFAIPVYINKQGTYAIEYQIIEKMADFERSSLLPNSISKIKANIETGLAYSRQ